MSDEQGRKRAEAIEIAHVPADGRQLRVVFLGNWYCLHTHWDSKRGRKGAAAACRGNECPARLHDLKTDRKFYAAGKWWERRGQAGVWVPAVIEVTETMWALFPDRDLRGDAYLLARRRLKPGWDNEIKFLERLDPSKLRDDIDVRAAVSIVYGHVAIEWSSNPSTPPRQVLEVEDADPPPVAAAVSPPEPAVEAPRPAPAAPASMAAIREGLAEAMRALGRAPGEARPSRQTGGEPGRRLSAEEIRQRVEGNGRH
jgi:hypothetical protein